MTPIASVASLTMECADAGTLATFWSSLLGLREEYAAEDRSIVSLAAEGYFLSFVQVDGYTPTEWPAGGQQQQMHLDLEVPDLDAGVLAAVALGAREADEQPRPSQWRVLLDPAGHPFCLMLPFGG